ncbi:MAG: sensor histidine kinase, partial [Peptostreptococcaceae bacterium]
VMEHEIVRKFSKKISKTIILIIVMVILFCSFTMSQYFLKIKLGETKDNLSTIAIAYGEGKDRISNIVDTYPIYNSIVQGYNKSNDIIVNKKFFTKNLEYKSLTQEDIDKALEPYKISVLNGNTISGIVKVSDIKGDIMIVGQPLKNKDNEITGAIFSIKFANEYNSILIGLNAVLSFSMIFILISIITPFYLMAKKIIVRLGSMTDVVMKMSEGDFSVRFQEEKNDPIGQLPRALNDLAIRLEKSESQSKLLEQTRRDYVANVTHELKTPVTSIRAMAEILKDGTLVDKVDKDKYYSMILRESVRLESLIKDMLELSRLQSGKESLEKSKVKLDETLLQVIDEFNIISEDLDIELIIEVDFENLVEVNTNINRIAQVLVILLDNAFKYTADNGSVTLKVRNEKECVKVSVCDTGVGVEEEDIPFIFDRFYKADKSHSSEGTGIGLSIAWEIMKNLDEDIYYESSEKYQSIFNFTIHYD